MRICKCELLFHILLTFLLQIFFSILLLFARFRQNSQAVLAATGRKGLNNWIKK